ncbi:hypothetical protein BC628DRAFT_1414341 [Trametes gibbosa]|nr:hypothetical protein BC628DRAFT_1414341 [Trametes gibbosa]
MGQYWKFFNLSMREVATPNGSDKLGTIAFVKQPFLVRSLAVPYTLPELAKYLANPPPPGRTAKKGLLSLPDEILTMLLESPETSYIETVYLAVTCKKLLSLACAQGAIISNTRDYYSASWAHCRIAAVGDEAHLDGMPDSVITPPMKEEIRDLLTTDHKYGVQGHLYAGLFLLNFQDPPCVNGLDRFYEDFRLRLSDADCRLVAAANAVTFPARDDWVLINVSKHEYSASQNYCQK